MDKKEIQKRRMMSYFIEATSRIIEEEGIEAVTVRRVADIAGYNSATLYNYFSDLEHLIFFASLKYLKDYALNLPRYINGVSNALEKYIGIWRCFCCYSFNNPRIYQTIFFNKYTDSLGDAIQAYYTIFPEELGEQPEDLLPMLLKQNIYERNIAVLRSCVNQGFLREEHITEINEMTLLIYQGMFNRVINMQIEYSIDDAVERTLKYIIKTLKCYNSAIEIE